MARGVCSSPLSSADEAEGATSSGFPELARGKRKPKAKRTVLQSKKLKPLEGKSSKKLVHDAPQEFIEYLAEQLSAGQQAKFETEFGGGQGYIVKLPSSSWKTKRKRDELESWIRALGFTSGATLKRNALRIASLKADVILSELRQKVPLIADDKEEDAVMETNLISEGEDASPGDDGKEQDGDYASDPALIRLKKYFKKLESQKLESSMEDVLAQPSIRRDRRLARRLSKLGRISGHRLSSIALSSDAFRSGISPHAEEERAGQSVLHLVLHSGLVDVKASKEVLRKVSTMWEKTTGVCVDYYGLLQVRSKHMCYTLLLILTLFPIFQSRKANLYSTAQLYTRHPRGHYLSDGAYKEVFKVYSLEQKRLEAISVMDIGDIGNQGVVRQEVAHSVLLSNACEHGICPNFLRIYDVFLAHEQPCPDRWGSKTRRKPTELLASGNAEFGAESQQQQTSSSDERERLFQYMRMEFCDGGDLEDFIGLQKNKVLPLDSVAVSFFFQMVFSLYCAREKFNLRHYDIKLLNFFLKDIGRANLSKAPGCDVVLHYMLEDACFVLQMPASFSYWVKLADYGAADSNPDNLGKPVTIDQFATLENSPIEFLLEGDVAEQSYAADTFSLGLCLLHLFTGSAPYEEILQDVHCPSELLKDLKALWTVRVEPNSDAVFA
ncbi:Protein kinase-like domain [Phytophthora cactorum]|nr:Protein kinase-like domain [Phytophthora cactorum]